jgi:TetR/AcrR family transcriptional regulator, repressor of fatR-cypB operon
MPTKDKVQKEDKREAILQATLELVAEHGLQHTPMSLISKHSGASAGIIYHYFTSKEDLMQSLYHRIKEDMSRAIVAADDPKQPLAKRFQTLWLSIFRYCLTHLQAMAFLEQYESMPTAKQREPWLQDGKQTLDDLLAYLHAQNLTESLPLEARLLLGLISDLRAQDLIKDLPLAAIGEFTLGTALRLARQATVGLMNPDDATLTEIAKACWDAIAR